MWSGSWVAWRCAGCGRETGWLWTVRLHCTSIMRGRDCIYEGLHGVTRDASVEISNPITMYSEFKGRILVECVSALIPGLDWRGARTKAMRVNVTNSEQRTSRYKRLRNMVSLLVIAHWAAKLLL